MSFPILPINRRYAGASLAARKIVSSPANVPTTSGHASRPAGEIGTGPNAADSIGSDLLNAIDLCGKLGQTVTID